MTNFGCNSIAHKDDECLFFNDCWRGSLGSFVDCTLPRLFDKKKAIAFLELPCTDYARSCNIRFSRRAHSSTRLFARAAKGLRLQRCLPSTLLRLPQYQAAHMAIVLPLPRMIENPTLDLGVYMVLSSRISKSSFVMSGIDLGTQISRANSVGA